MDLLELETPMEEEFVALVNYGWPKEVFLDSALKIIGGDWEMVGRDIIKDEAPHLLKRFESYVEAGN